MDELSSLHDFSKALLSTHKEEKFSNWAVTPNVLISILSELKLKY